VNYGNNLQYMMVLLRQVLLVVSAPAFLPLGKHPFGQSAAAIPAARLPGAPALPRRGDTREKAAPAGMAGGVIT